MSKTYTFADVGKHGSKKDLWIVVHDKVYDATSFVDEHPGGEEVLSDVGGQDATEAFEDVGHSDEAREILSGLMIGDLKREPGDAKSQTVNLSKGGQTTTQTSAGSGIGLYLALLLAAAVAVGAYVYTQGASEKK